MDFILKTGSSQPALQLSITPEMEARGHFVQANELYQSGNYERAIGEYLRALDLAPADIEILNNLGAAYCATGRPDQAKAVFEKANSIDPQNETVSRNLESLALMENSSKKEPFSLIEIHSGGGEQDAPPPAPKKPQEDRVEAPSPKPEPEPPPPDAVKEVTPSDTPQIAAAPREAAHLPGPDDARRQPEAIAPPENIKKEIPIPSSPAKQEVPPEQSSRDHFNMGVFKESEGDIEGALAHYREAVLLEPANAIAQYNLGNIYFRLGAFDSAIECYRASLKADSTFSRSYNNIGVAYYKLGRVEDAKEAWRRALKADPALESARENLVKYGGDI
jgi:tetratricopeptide (TPR) repeat protein